ncbi:MAG: response regulator [Deltaproteobacteria bacterium]|nr:response regulator [Deltaproteobacteria bacterium]
MKRALLPIAVFVALSGVSFFFWRSLERNNDEEIRRVVDARVDHFVDRMKGAVKTRFDALARLAKRFEEWAPPKHLWEADVGRYIVDYPELQAISWNDASNVVRWFLPKRGNEKVDGLQIDKEPVRREALRVARETRALVATKTLDLVQGRRGFVVFIPVSRFGESVGSIASALVTADFIRAVVEKSVVDQLELTVTEGDEILFETRLPPNSSLVAVNRPLEASGLSWQVQAAPTTTLIASVRSAVPEVVFGGGIISSAFLALMLLGFLGARQREKKADDARQEISQLNARMVERSAELEGASAQIEALAKKLSSDLATSQTEFRAIIETAPIGIGIVRGPKVVFANETLARSVGYERPADVIGLTMMNLVHPDDVPNVVEKMRLSATVGVSPPLVIRGLRKDGGITVLSMSQGRRINFEGAPAQFAILRDITDERRLQEQVATADRLATIGLMAAGVAHEINNPLAAAVGNLSFLASQVETLQRGGKGSDAESDDDGEGDLPAASQIAALVEPISDAREALERVRVITRDLKTFARSEEERKERVDVERVIEASLRIAWPEIKNRARLVKEYGAVQQIVANEARLGQVILNLVVNAAQAIPPGDRNRQQIRVRTKSDAKGNVVIRVSDTGCGITPENLGRIWEPFFTTKHRGEGTGLGLSICKRLVDEMGGTISVESAVGEGTTFTVHLPRAEEMRDAESERPAKIENAGDLARARVLVVDDETGMGNAVRRLLEPRHSVVVVERGAEALDRLRRGEKFDVVLMDILMPEMNGIQLFARLREVSPTLAEHTIFMTGGMANAQVREFLESVANPRLEKPFDPKSLAVLVNERVSTPKARA